jgi:hypothetical protein
MMLPLVLSVVLGVAGAAPDNDDVDPVTRAVGALGSLMSDGEDQDLEDETALTGPHARNVGALAVAGVPWALMGPMAMGAASALCGVSCVSCLVGSGTANPPAAGLAFAGGMLGLAGLMVATVAPPVLAPLLTLMPYVALSSNRGTATVRWMVAATASLAAMVVASVVATGAVAGFAFVAGSAFNAFVFAGGGTGTVTTLDPRMLLLLAGLSGWLALVLVALAAFEAGAPLTALGVMTGWDALLTERTQNR